MKIHHNLLLVLNIIIMYLNFIFSLFENELEYTHQLLEDDVRNNSAWNQRYFVINFVSDFDEKIVHQEIEYALNAILKVSKNESAWNYLRGYVFSFFFYFLSLLPEKRANCDLAKFSISSFVQK